MLPLLIGLFACLPSLGDAGVRDADEDGAPEHLDCDDKDASRYPGAPELCDELDQDCDDVVDEDAIDPETFHRDRDDDGYGDPEESFDACDVPDGFVDDSSDCNDGQAFTFPGADERCDELDNDCDTQVDEDVTYSTWYFDLDEDGWGDDLDTTVDCDTPSGYVPRGGDCNDNNATIHPERPEDCNGRDDDCDSAVDEGAPGSTFYYADLDGDDFGDDDTEVYACLPPTDEHIEQAGDCDDDNEDVNPDASDDCNAIDDDCSGKIDDAGECPCPVVEDGSTYMICDDARDWSEAYDYCADYGYQLAVIETEAEDTVLDKLLSGYSGFAYAIGLSEDPSGSDNWIWVDGSTPGYLGWGSGEPNNYEDIEDCGEIVRTLASWNDVSCDAESNFICEAY